MAEENVDLSVMSSIGDAMEAFAAGCGADGVTLWLARGEELVGVLNPLESADLGLFRQSLKSGLISQVFLTGQSLLELDLKHHPSHDQRIDRLLGRNCRTLMASPLDIGEGGVISAVQREGGKGGSDFGLSSLQALADLAREIETMWNEEG